MYSITEKEGIILGSKQKFIELISKANLKDEVGCDSSMYWTVANHLDNILNTIGTSFLTEAQQQKLYERLIDYKNKPLN